MPASRRRANARALGALGLAMAGCSHAAPASKPTAPAFPPGIAENQREKILLSSYVQIMRDRYLLTPEAIDSPYLRRFMLRPIEVASEERLPILNARDLFNDILDETYFPIVVKGDGYRKAIVDPVPRDEIEAFEKYPGKIAAWRTDRASRPSARRIAIVHPAAEKPAGDVSTGDPLVIGLLPVSDTSDSFLATTMRAHPRGNLVLIGADLSGGDARLDRVARAVIDEVYKDGAPRAYSIENWGPEAQLPLVTAVRERVQAYAASTPALPRRLFFRSATEGISFRYYVVLKDGQFWLKSNEEFTGVAEAWSRLGPPAIPADLKSPVALSTDGVAFLIEEQDGTLVRSGEFFEAPNHWVWERRMGWLGLPLLSTNVLKHDGAKQLDWNVTDNSARVGWEDDLLGTHYAFAAGIDGKPGGIAQIYALGRDGLSVYSNDFWVTADWRRIAGGPFRGRMRMRNLSASGSSLFVITEKGDLFTCYWNYNTSGASFTSSYTLDPARIENSGSVVTRFLPVEPWYQQPPITDGELTDRITILQTGHGGNQARALRVEGRRQGVSGYFTKLIFEERWRFVPTQERVVGNPIDNRMIADRTEESLAQDGLLAPSQDRDYAGTLHLEGAHPATLAGFNLYSSPAELRIGSGDAEVSLLVHSALSTPLTSNKDDFFRKPLELNDYEVYLELPQSFLERAGADPGVEKVVRALRNTWKTEGGRYFRAKLTANEQGATLMPSLANPFSALCGDLREIRFHAAE